MHLDTHASIAFAAGHELDIKSGIDVAPIQTGYKGKQVWRVDDLTNNGCYVDWKYIEKPLGNGDDVAIAISATHNIFDEVLHYVNQSKLPIGRIIGCSVNLKGPGISSVEGANHAFFLASSIAKKLKDRELNEKYAKLHIFYCGPNSLMFFLGQFSKTFGPCIVYEYDFEKQIPGAYQPSISFP